MIKEKILSNIKTIREAKDLSGEYLAAQMGISQATYSRKEKGEIDFSLNDLLKVSEVLEVPMAKLVDQDLAKVITQNNNISDTATGNTSYLIENQNNTAEGYKVAIETQKEEIAHLRAQVDKLIEKLG